MKPKTASKAKKAASKATYSATEISLASNTTHTAIIQGQITSETTNTQAIAASIRTKKASKDKKETVKGTNTDTLLGTPNTTERDIRQIEASAAAIQPKKSKGKKAANKGIHFAYEVSEAPPAIQMVTNQDLGSREGPGLGRLPVRAGQLKPRLKLLTKELRPRWPALRPT